MCLLTIEDKNGYINVNKTCIFARNTSHDRQLLVYSMSIQTNTNAAMILPIPVKKESGEDAVHFIDMSVSLKDFTPDIELFITC